MSNLLEQIDDYIVKVSDRSTEGSLNVDYDEELFDKMVDFIVSLDPDQLTEDQLGAITEIIEDFEFEEQVSDEPVAEARFLRKTTRAQRKKQALWRKRNKAKIKAWRRQNKQKLKRARKTGRGLTGRKRGLFKRRPGGPAAS